jgi:hypothetical protein
MTLAALWTNTIIAPCEKLFHHFSYNHVISSVVGQQLKQVDRAEIEMILMYEPALLLETYPFFKSDLKQALSTYQRLQHPQRVTKKKTR